MVADHQGGKHQGRMKQITLPGYAIQHPLVPSSA
jgi:hypothetical protein